MIRADGMRARLGAAPDSSVAIRLPFVAAGLILVFLVFVLRLFQLQIIEGQDLTDQSQRNFVRTLRLEAPRGDVLDRFGRRHVPIPLRFLGNLFLWLAGALGDDRVKQPFVLEDLFGLDADVFSLAADAAVRLVQHDLGVGQDEAFSLGARHQQDSRSAHRLTDAVGGHGAVHHLHGVVDCQRLIHQSARRVNVKMDIFSTIFTLQIEQFHDKLICISIIDFTL